MEKNLKLSNLLELLEQLRHYYSAPSDFIRRLSKKVNTNLPRKTFNDILEGRITFERDKWVEYLPIAHDIAHQVLLTHKAKLEKDLLDKSQAIKPKEFFQFDNSIKFVENTVERCDFLFEKGEMTASIGQISDLNNFIKIQHIYANNPYLYGYFYLVFAKLQMQFGVTDGETGSIKLAERSISTFQQLEKEQKRLFQAINLQGHIFRQLNEYEKALDVFKRAQNLIDVTSLDKGEKEKLFMNTQHQLGLTLMRQGEKTKKRYFFEEAKRLFSQSNSFFENSNDEKWYKFSMLREAELYVKSSELEKAEKILDFYEDPCEISLMTRARIAIFHRINTERYLNVNDIKNALRYFKAAVTLSLEEDYKHELEQLSNLYLRYKSLKVNLPEHFSVYQPIWKN